jgi:hypothetical protein
MTGSTLGEVNNASNQVIHASDLVVRSLKDAWDEVSLAKYHGKMLTEWPL